MLKDRPINNDNVQEDDSLPPSLQHSPTPSPPDSPMPPLLPSYEDWTETTDRADIILSMRTKIDIFHREVEKETLLLMHEPNQARIAEIDQEIAEMWRLLASIGIS